jgi:hypothetical protein
MATVHTCDQCGETLSESRSVELAEYWTDDDGDDAEKSYDFCSWECVRQTAALRALEESLGQKERPPHNPPSVDGGIGSEA